MDRITPDNIQYLVPGQVFVFGSNREGRHGKGAAKTANQRFGAKHGISFGLTGDSFAIPTVDLLPLRKTLPNYMIQGYIWNFIGFAERHPELTFLVTEIGCGLAGLTPEIVAPMFCSIPPNPRYKFFKTAVEIENIYLPKRFWEVIKNINE